MSKKDQKPSSPNNNLIALPVRCLVENCKSKPNRISLCEEHFAWFKEGLISRDGSKAKDFDKKHQAMLNRQNKNAA